MYLRLVALMGLFGTLSVGSYYSVVAPLARTSIDDDFYQDLSLLSRFDENNVGYQGTIESDDLGIRNYLFHNSFNLIWKGNTPNEAPVTGNAFLLNLLIPDWMNDFHPDRKNYNPKSYISGDDVVLLLGTSFSFASQLFDQISNWSTDVNNKEVTSVNGSIPDSDLTLDKKSSKSSSHKLLFSHPWPSLSNESSKWNQQYAYVLGNETYASFDDDVQRPYYFSVEPKNVEAIYAAVDLSLNQEIIKLNLGSNNRMMYQLYKTHKLRTHDQIKWEQNIKDIYGQEFKFAVDFAVIKVKLNISQLKHHFLDYITEVYKKNVVLPKVLDSYLEIKNDRTKSMYIGGWEPMNEREVDFHTMDRLFVKPKSPQSKTNSQEVELDIFETYQPGSNNAPTPSQKYEIVDKKWSFFEGLSFLKYRIKNKEKKWILPHYRDLVAVYDDQKVSSDKDVSILKDWKETRIMKDRKLIEFLEAQPKVHARWKEYGVKYSYFSFQNTQNNLWNKSILRSIGALDTINQNTSLEFFKCHNTKYVNLAHHLEIPNMYLNNGKGVVSVMQHTTRMEKTLLGMYDGVSQWTNPISGQKRYVGKVALFISPWRYDLFNYQNNLSKPSLGDVLVKKKLHTRLVQENRFRI